jgi:hypothetical protein
MTDFQSHVFGITRGVAGLSAAVVVILSVWGWVLPTIGNAPTIRRSIDHTQQMGINPAAIFYTDVYEKTKTPKPLWQQ